MSESSEKEMDKIKQRIRELAEKSGVKFYAEGEIWPGDALTAEEQEELARLYDRLDELKKDA